MVIKELDITKDIVIGQLIQSTKDANSDMWERTDFSTYSMYIFSQKIDKTKYINFRISKRQTFAQRQSIPEAAHPKLQMRGVPKAEERSDEVGMLSYMKICRLIYAEYYLISTKPAFKLIFCFLPTGNVPS